MIRAAFAICAVALAVTTAHAAPIEHIDRENRFRVTIPDSWQKLPAEGDTLDLVITSPRYNTTSAMCSAVGEPKPAWESATQEQLNGLSFRFNEAYWRNMVAEEGTTDIKIEATTEVRNGRNVYLAKAEYTTKEKDGTENRWIDRYAIQNAPGVFLMTLCGSYASKEEVERADILTFVGSHEPVSATNVVAGLKQPQPQTLPLTLDNDAAPVVQAFKNNRATRRNSHR
jgi:hypothetical protein